MDKQWAFGYLDLFVTYRFDEGEGRAVNAEA